MRYISMFMGLLLIGCAAHEIEFKSDKIIFSLKNDRDTYFHYSVDNFVPHKMEKDGNYRKIIVNKSNEFKFFYTDDRGLIKVDCPLLEYDDFGNYNCIINM